MDDNARPCQISCGLFFLGAEILRWRETHPKPPVAGKLRME